MTNVYETAAGVHPGMRVSLADFEAAWAARPGATEARAADVYCAAAIAANDPVALLWLQRQVQHGTRVLGARVPQQVVAEVESNVIALVAVGTPNHPPRIGSYQAKGPLVAWLQVIIARVAADRSQAAPHERLGDHELETSLIASLEATSPELRLHRQRYHGTLAPALRRAAEALTPKERSLILLHYVRGVSLEELAGAYQVHRATISRWLADARQSFLASARDHLSASTGIGRLELDSLIFALERHEELSLSRIFTFTG